ncbi:hypothetical protein LIA77_10646 [Sarocladium implicatum]|nr:hypothetical protein LIA77_10646 [Sarocladium implicatum]
MGPCSSSLVTTPPIESQGNNVPSLDKQGPASGRLQLDHHNQTSNPILTMNTQRTLATLCNCFPKAQVTDRGFVKTRCESSVSGYHFTGQRAVNRGKFVCRAPDSPPQGQTSPRVQLVAAFEL